MVNKPQSSPDSKNRILEAARAEFAERGFDGARVDTIAKRAEVNKALIYYYYKSKNELLQELLRGYLEARRQARARIPDDDTDRDLPQRVARFDVDFLYQHRDILRIALMEDLKSSNDAPPGPGTIMKHWLEGLAESREDYAKQGYRFRFTPRVVTAMFFFHLIPTLAFGTMGDTLALATRQDIERLREEFMKLLQESTSQHFHSVFGASCTDPSPEVPLPGLIPRPASDLLQQAEKAFQRGKTYTAEQVEWILASLTGQPTDLFARLVGFRHLTMEPGGLFRWTPLAPELPANPPSPAEHLKTSPDERAALVAKHMPQGRLSVFPNKEKARIAVIEHISGMFRSDRVYSEKEVDTLLKSVADDHAKARRYLIDYQYLHRKPDGSQYWTWDHDAPG
ncbi:MAG TPA: DUF2087 domain-containing protein [Fibrobacteria bacterium]|nr:DUF2087 domain-containing protein [Fibrobacteria bacterium]HOX50199.1 DUF2087 domain-containing protein [Fibrobacteria bacterium]